MPEWHAKSLPGGNQDASKLFDVLAFVARETKLDRISRATFDGGADVEATKPDLNDVHEISDAQPITGERQAIGQNLHVRLTLRSRGGHTHGAGHLTHEVLDLEGDLLNGFEIGAKDLNAHLGPNSGAEHQNPVLDRLQKSWHVAGDEAELFGKLGNNLLPGHAQLARRREA